MTYLYIFIFSPFIFLCFFPFLKYFLFKVYQLVQKFTFYYCYFVLNNCFQLFLYFIFIHCGFYINERILVKYKHRPLVSLSIQFIYFFSPHTHCFFYLLYFYNKNPTFIPISLGIFRFFFFFCHYIIFSLFIFNRLCILLFLLS